MIINIDTVKKIIDSDLSASYIASEVEISEATIKKYRQGKSDVLNMTLAVALKLQKLSEKLEDKPMTDIKIKGIKKAVGEFNSWQGAARIYFDTSDLSVWTNVYGGPGERDNYKDDNIVEVAQKATHIMAERDDTITMAKLKELCADVL